MEMWFGQRGGNRFMSFKPYSGEYYVTIGNGATLTNNGYKLQVNGNAYINNLLTTAAGISNTGTITSTGTIEAGGKVRAYGGNRGNILTLLFDGYFGYDTSTSSNVNTVYVNKTGSSNPMFNRTGTGQYTLTFVSPTYISTILLCIVKDATNFFYVSSNVSTSGGGYIFSFKTANDYSLDDAVFRVSMLYELS